VGDMPGRTFSSEQYRYGYQGSERDPEMFPKNRDRLGGAGYTTFFRALDPRIGRWLTPDPKVFPWQSPYVSMDGNPVALVDVWGAQSKGPKQNKKTGLYGKGNKSKLYRSYTPGHSSSKESGMLNPSTLTPMSLMLNEVFDQMTGNDKMKEFGEMLNSDYSDRKAKGWPTEFLGNAKDDSGNIGILTDDEGAVISIMTDVGKDVEVGAYILEDNKGDFLFYLMGYSGFNSTDKNTDNQPLKKNKNTGVVSIKINGKKYRVLAQVHTHLAIENGFEGPSIDGDRIAADELNLPIITIGKSEISRISPGVTNDHYEDVVYGSDKRNRSKTPQNRFKVGNTADVKNGKSSILDYLRF